MQIQSINSTYYGNIKNSFAGWDQNALNILGRDEEQMKELGIEFHKASYGDILDAGTIRNFLGITLKEKTENARIRLLMAVEQARNLKNKYLTEIEKIKLKAEIKKRLTKNDKEMIKELHAKIATMEDQSKDHDRYYIEEPIEYKDPEEDERAYKDFVDHFIRL